MAGLYIHIPFCKQACYYCDFHFSTNKRYREKMIDSICHELELRKDYLNSAALNTIYFGGGTPSILSATELEKVFGSVYQLFEVNEKAEITLEANPDDLSEEKLTMIKSLGVNRLSIGVQSFQNKILKTLNRAHDATEAVKCIELARKIGFENLSIDLIFSIPWQTLDDLQKDINQALFMDPEHISVYSLTIEDKTVFGNWQKKGKFQAMGDDVSAEHFELLISTLEKHGYEQYEISNFCRDQKYAQHNTAYWKNIQYLGVGPGAHSYNGRSRQYNISKNHAYMKSISSGIVPFGLDELQNDALANEYLLTTLRTKWGCDLTILQKNYGYDLLEIRKEKIHQLIREGFILMEKNMIFLTRKGKFLADDIIGDLFWL